MGHFDSIKLNEKNIKSLMDGWPKDTNGQFTKEGINE